MVDGQKRENGTVSGSGIGSVGASGSRDGCGSRRRRRDEITPEFHTIRRVTSRRRVLLSSLYRVRFNNLGPSRQVCLPLLLLTLVVPLGTRTGLHSLP